MALISYPPLQPRNWPRSIEAGVPGKALRDLGNRLRFGARAPLSDECIFIPPLDVTQSYRPAPDAGAPAFRRTHSGLVARGDWDLSVSAIGGNIKHRACMMRYRDGMAWEETGLFEDMLEKIARHGAADGCRSIDDIRARYARLDALAEEIKRTGKMRRRADIPGGYFRREHGGVFVHIGRGGEILRAGGGIHRFAIAQALGLPVMPAQLGVIHRDALEAGLLQRLRRPNR